MSPPAWKRPFDLALAGPAVVVLSPVMLGVAAAVRLSMGSPVLFEQVRPGMDEQPFRLLKFRTMRDAVGPDGEPLPDDVRITWVGKVLRLTSLDELPELLNVLRGDMSLVGPRPLLVRYLPYYKPEERLRFTIRPGITGLAQIAGRNQVPWDERLALDVEYVQKCSPWLDLQILARTVLSVVRSEGVNVVNMPTATMDNLDVERRDAPWVRRA